MADNIIYLPSSIRMRIINNNWVQVVPDDWTGPQIMDKHKFEYEKFVRKLESVYREALAFDLPPQ